MLVSFCRRETHEFGAISGGSTNSSSRKLFCSNDENSVTITDLQGITSFATETS